ncbi:PAS domain-containing sensor histidine kinase [Longitalea luteola]|uniref:PAS domain-containing sensor histidine kinase n=1 Tax=Longitalea luteola TaxID=2812563 RepID=UPI001A97B2A0|nr:PAS domain S-box protein [Longitalea luteola]
MSPWLEAILNDCQDAVFITDRHLNLLHWNVMAEELWFKQSRRPAKKNIVDFLNQLFPGHIEVQNQLQRAIALDEQVEDIFVSTPDDKTYRISCYTHKFPGTQYLLDVVIILRDLQAVMQGKKVIRPDAMYKTLFNSLEEGVLLLHGELGTIISANNKACEITGFTHDQIIGKNLIDVGGRAYYEDGSPMPVEDYPGIITLKTGAIFNKSIMGFTNASGILTWLSVSTCLLEEFNDSVPGLVACTFNDITACREAQSRLSDHECMFQSFEKKATEEINTINERFYYTTKATSDYIWDWNITTGTIYRSEPFSQLTGYTQNDMENDLYWLLDKIHAEDRQGVMQQINAVLLARKSYWHIEYRFRCADGKYIYVSDKAYIIYKDGNAVRAIGAIQDLTEKRKLEEELALQKEKERLRINQAMITGQEYERNEISKELHDNVNQILSSAMIMLTAARGNADDQEYLIDKTTQYIDMAIQEIRKISKSLNSSIVNEVGLIDPVEDIIKNMQLVRPLTVDFQCDPSLEEELSQDKQLMLYRIIQEQTNNIMRYAEASYVRIAIEQQGNRLSLSIEDNGKGFDTKKQTKGIGLLNILNRAETLGGTLTIDSKPMGGCRLQVQIPLI